MEQHRIISLAAFTQKRLTTPETSQTRHTQSSPVSINNFTWVKKRRNVAETIAMGTAASQPEQSQNAFSFETSLRPVVTSPTPAPALSHESTKVHVPPTVNTADSNLMPSLSDQSRAKSEQLSSPTPTSTEISSTHNTAARNSVVPLDLNKPARETTELNRKPAPRFAKEMTAEPPMNQAGERTTAPSALSKTTGTMRARKEESPKPPAFSSDIFSDAESTVASPAEKRSPKPSILKSQELMPSKLSSRGSILPGFSPHGVDHELKNALAFRRQKTFKLEKHYDGTGHAEESDDSDSP